MRKFLALAALLVSCSEAAPPTTPAATPSSTTQPPRVATTTTSTTTTTTSSTTTTTLAIPEGVSVIASLGAVMGIWNGEWTVIEATEELPPMGSKWQVFSSPGEPPVPRIGNLTGSDFYCDPVPYQRPVVDFGDDWPFLAVQADWPLVPHSVEDFTGQLDAYIDAVTALLAGQGLVVDSAHINQLVRTDLEGDGVDEVIVVATEGNRTDIYTPATDQPFELVILRKLVEGEVQTAILELRLPDVILGDDGFPFLNEFEVVAVIDANGDGKMEIALRGGYYEGSWLDIWEYVNDDLGPVAVLSIGCGA